MEALKHFIRKHPKIDYLQKCLRHVSDEKFVKNVLDYQRDYNIFRVDMLNVDDYRKPMYAVMIGNSINGFFAFFREVIDELYLADKMGWEMYIEYSLDIPYAEGKGVNGRQNPFEYYFTQPFNVGKDEASKRSIQIQYERSHALCAETVKNNSIYYPTDEYIKRMAPIVRKYIHLQPDIEKRLRNDMENLNFTNEKVLGIHYRGTDYKREYRNHPVRVTEEEYFVEIDKVLASEHYSKMFIATDDKQSLLKFREKYGDALICYENTVRSSGQNSVIFSENLRDKHHFELGYDVLRDALTLAECDGFVGGTSLVSTISRIFSLANKHSFLNEIVLDKGIKAGGKTYEGKV